MKNGIQETSVLVVDDDPDFLDLLSAALKKIPGVKVNIARNPAQAIRMLTRNTYKLIVSDWAISSSTAPEVLKQVDHLIDDQRQNPDPIPYSNKVPVMFISGSEKVSQTQRLNTLRHFEPVSFLLKRCGPPLISLLAEHILARFYTSSRPAVMQPC